MKIVNRNRKEKGIGLIEILIVLVVLVIGWAAIAALQGTLMSGSAESKARNEALELAREKTEEMRNAVEKGKYVSDLAVTSGTNDPDGTITGVNATFTRSWILDSVDVNGDGTKEDYIKQLSMRVSWANNEGDTQDVVLNSMIAFSSASKMGTLATGGSGDVGKTAAPGSYSGQEGPVRPGITINPGTLDVTGDSGDGSDSIFTSTDADGNLVVYTGSNLASNVNLTVFGGKILKFTGMIYYDSPEPYVQATSPAYCTSFLMAKSGCGITSNGSAIDCAKYVCYAGGDCSNGGFGCPASEAARDDLPQNLNGGWYGKIGDFFPTLTNANKFPTICMGDSIGVPARLYVTERYNPGSTTGIEREGINTSFDCSDTLISAPNDGACSSMISELESYGIAINPNGNPNEIADFEIVRSLNSYEGNIVLAATSDSYYNGVFDNYCGGGTPSSSSSSGATSSSSSGATSSSSSGATSSSSSGATSSSSSGATSSSSSGSSSGGPGYTHNCSCKYKNKTGMIVTGEPVSGVPAGEIGCCSQAGCYAAMGADLNNPPANNTGTVYSCPVVP